jgi:hypothetical protein
MHETVPNNAMHLSRHLIDIVPTQISLRPGDGKRSKVREEKAESPGCKRGLEGVGRSC